MLKLCPYHTRISNTWAVYIAVNSEVTVLDGDILKEQNL